MASLTRLRKLAPVMSVLVLLALLLAACGGGARQPARARDTAEQGMAAPAAPDSDYASGGSGATTQPGESTADQPASGQMPQLAPGGAPAGADPSLGRKIIINADIGLEVADAARARVELQRLADVSRGYIAESNISGSDDHGWTARVVLRIPQNNFSSVYNEIRELGTLREERQWSNDVTAEFVDLEARLKVLQMHEQTLMDLQSKAQKFEDWERLQSRLIDVRIQIEQIQGRMRVLNNMVDFATLNISLYQPPKGKEITPREEPSLGQRMIRAFQESARAVWAFAETLLVFLAAALPVFGFMVLLAIAVYLLVRAFRSRQGPGAPPPAPPAAES